MSILKTKYQRLSFITTSLILFIIIVLIFFFGLTYLSPPIEYGIELNFGTSRVGSGIVQASTVKKVIKSKRIKENQIKKTQGINTKKNENILTQENNKDVISIDKKSKNKKTAKTIQKTKVKPKPKPDKTTTEAFSNILNAYNKNDNESKSDGTDVESGDKGNKEGTLKAKGYYKVGGKGNYGNYNLGNRKPLNTPKPIYDCNEEGRIVVRIVVDKTGNVIEANPGVKGSTNSAPCLLKRAKEAALKTLWQKDAKASDKQVGSIIYNFEIQN